MTDARDKLAAAIVERDKAEAAVNDAESALVGARQFVATLEAEIKQFAVVDTRIAAERASAVKAALSKGQAPNFTTSSALAAAIAAKVEAENQWTAAKTALKELEREAREAGKVLAEASSVVSLHVEAVAVEEATTRAQEIERRDAETLRLRCEIDGISMTRRLDGGRQILFRLGETLTHVLEHNSLNTTIGTTNSPAQREAEAARGRWGEFVKALAIDARATF